MSRVPGKYVGLRRKRKTECTRCPEMLGEKKLRRIKDRGRRIAGYGPEKGDTALLLLYRLKDVCKRKEMGGRGDRPVKVTA